MRDKASIFWTKGQQEHKHRHMKQCGIRSEKCSVLKQTSQMKLEASDCALVLMLNISLLTVSCTDCLGE